MESAIAFFYPRRCPLCGQIVRVRGSLACPGCASRRHPLEEPVCLRCGKPIADGEQEYCGGCAGREFPFERCFALWPYDAGMKRSIHGFKYLRRREYADFYVEQLLGRFGEKLGQLAFDAVIPVPIHRSRRRERTFNQAELLAEGIAEGLGLPMISDLLVRSRRTTPQKELDPQKRRRNLSGAFKICERSPAWKRYWRRVLLVDDIYTTGSTASACAQVLKQAGVGEIYVLCLCVGNGI